MFDGEKIMKKYVVKADSVTFRGAVLKKGHPLKLSDEDAKQLLKTGAIEEKKAEAKPEPKTEEKKK